MSIEDAIPVPAHCLPVVVTHRAAPSFRGLLLYGSLLLLAVSSFGIGSVSAQSAVERSDPPMEETITVTPAQIGIWFVEPLEDEPDAISIQLIDSAGRVRALGSPSIYAVDPRHVSAPVDDELPTGTYSVLWTARFAADQLGRSGAYGFRVGSAVAAGAATEVDAVPALWAIVTRLLTLFGLALGGLVAGRFASIPDESPETGRGRRLVILGGGALALIGTIAEPAFAALVTVPSSPLTPTLAGYPATWWPRTGALLALIAASLILLTSAADSRVRPVAWLAATVAGAVALVATCSSGLALDSAPPNAVASGAVIVVQATIVLLTGIAMQMALFGPSLPAADRPDRPPRLAREAFPNGPWLTAALAAIALVSAVLLGAAIIPGMLSPVERLFGQLLSVTGLLLAAILLLAILVRRGVSAAGRWGLAALATLSLGSATMLALVLPPSTAAMTDSLATVNLVDPVPVTVAGEPGLVHLQFQPVMTGENAFIAWLSTVDGVTPPPAEQPDFAIELRSLSDDAPPIMASPVPGDTGVFTVSTASLPSTGWWQATATVTPATGEEATADFFLLVPDPNVSGYGPRSQPSAAAAAVFKRGLASMTSLQQVRFSIVLGSGAGTFASSEIVINDGGDGSTRGYHERATGYETVIVGDQQWVRFDGEEWSERQAGFINVPAGWGDIYAGATDFALGPIVEVGGEPTQVVSFWLPRQEEPRQEPAWYAWWVGIETGQVHRETMISNRHYMVYTFADFNQPVEITPPADL